MEFSSELNRTSTQISREFICSICQNITWKPKECVGCESLNCKHCLRVWIKKKNGNLICPNCKAQKGWRKPHRILTNILYELEIECKYPGCKKMLKYGVLYSHERRCTHMCMRCPNAGCTMYGKKEEIHEHLGDCNYSLVQCKYEIYGCKLQGTRVKIKEHLGVCEYKPVPCDYCEMLFQVHNLGKHKENCPERPLSCLQCGGIILLKNKGAHNCLKLISNSLGLSSISELWDYTNLLRSSINSYRTLHNIPQPHPHPIILAPTNSKEEMKEIPPNYNERNRERDKRASGEGERDLGDSLLGDGETESKVNELLGDENIQKVYTFQKQ